MQKKETGHKVEGQVKGRDHEEGFHTKDTDLEANARQRPGNRDQGNEEEDKSKQEGKEVKGLP